MTGDDSPWTSSYELDGETESLLRYLERRPLTDDEVRRHFVNEIDVLLDPDTREELERRMVGGAAGLLGLDVGSFSKAVGWWERTKRDAQETIDWSQLPQDLREASERRARSVLDYAGGRGWIERDESGPGWRITETGRAFLASGGFNMR